MGDLRAVKFAALGAVVALGVVAGEVPSKGQSGSLTGTVRLSGEAPRNPMIPMEADPNCMMKGRRKAHKVRQQEVVVGRGGGLANVFVRLAGDGLTGAAGPVPEELVVIEQRGCVYHPRMTGARAGQTLRVVNGDDTIHNVRSISEAGSEFNIGQPSSGMAFDFELAAEETMLRLRCDIHPWMFSFIGVVGHPWFVVTGDDGRFDLQGVPPGDYDVLVWHERFATLRGAVSIEAGGVATLDFDYRVNGASPHLERLPRFDLVLRFLHNN